MTLDQTFKAAKAGDITNDATYKVGEISRKTGLQKQPDGSWAPPKGTQKAPAKKEDPTMAQAKAIADNEKKTQAEGKAYLQQSVSGYSNQSLKQAESTYKRNLEEFDDDIKSLQRRGLAPAQIAKRINSVNFAKGALEAITEEIEARAKKNPDGTQEFQGRNTALSAETRRTLNRNISELGPERDISAENRAYHEKVEKERADRDASAKAKAADLAEEAKERKFSGPEMKDFFLTKTYEGRSVDLTQRGMEAMGWDLLDSDDTKNIYGKPDGSRVTMQLEGNKIKSADYKTAAEAKKTESGAPAASQDPKRTDNTTGKDYKAGQTVPQAAAMQETMAHRERQAMQAYSKLKQEGASSDETYAAAQLVRSSRDLGELLRVIAKDPENPLNEATAEKLNGMLKEHDQLQKEVDNIKSRRTINTKKTTEGIEGKLSGDYLQDYKQIKSYSGKDIDKAIQAGAIEYQKSHPGASEGAALEFAIGNLNRLRDSYVRQDKSFKNVTEEELSSAATGKPAANSESKPAQDADYTAGSVNAPRENLERKLTGDCKIRIRK